MRVTMKMVQRPGIPLSGDLSVSFGLYGLDHLIILLFINYVGLNSYLLKLDDRGKKKLGRNATRVVERRYGTQREGAPPKKFPAWMVAEAYTNTETSPRSDAPQSTCTSNIETTPTNYRNDICMVST